ncbi:hypothetical protein JTB14_006955 [Gonioctena quinquepunctata]|nr:hypothetical protein JTB14_006955 [Gonioctena quinquepunctata]
MELSKLDQKRSGDGADDEPQSKWQYFKNMLFVRDQFAPRQTIGNIENATQYSTGAEMDEDATLGPMNNNDHSQLEIETDDQSQLDFATGDQSQAEIVTEINQQSSSNNKKRSATDQSKSNKTNPPQKKIVKYDAIQALMHIEKEKLQQFKQHLEHKQDDDTYFLLSLLPYIQSLPVYRKMFLRSKILQLVMQEHETVSSPETQHPSTSRQFIPIPRPSPIYSTTSTEFSQPPTPVQLTNESSCCFINNYTDGTAAGYLTNFQPNTLS